MTEEKAIERCEDIIKKNNKVVKEARKAGDTNAMQLVAELDTESLAIKTVLNKLKEKDKEIEKLKKNNKEVLRKLRNRVKEVKKLNKYSLYKKEFKTLNEQLKKKDKIIDLMAENIFQEGIIWDDKEDIKQYFKSKAEKECI